MEDQLHRVGGVPAGQDSRQTVHHIGRHGDIIDAARIATVEMSVGGKVRTVPSRLPLDIDLLDQATSDEGFEAVIDRRDRNCRHAGFRPGINFIRRRMIPLVQQNAEYRLPLRSASLTRMVQCFAQHPSVVLF